MLCFGGGGVLFLQRLQFHKLFRGPPTERDVMSRLVDSGFKADLVVSTLVMNDPAKCCDHLGFHPRVALPFLA